MCPSPLAALSALSRRGPLADLAVADREAPLNPLPRAARERVEGPMAGTMEARHVSVTIERSPAEVYDFASDPANLPLWARGLSGSIVRSATGDWVADSPTGKVRVRMAPRNTFGVLDHDVVLESGRSFHVPLRVVPNGTGSEVVFTLLRQPGTTDAQLAADLAAVERDLAALKRLLER